jgi:hypothetical protein
MTNRVNALQHTFSHPFSLLAQRYIFLISIHDGFYVCEVDHNLTLEQVMLYGGGHNQQLKFNLLETNLT